MFVKNPSVSNIRISEKTDGSDDKSKNLLIIMKNIVKQQKNPCIPPLLQGNKYVTDFKKNAELFNLLFAKQCSKIDYSSELPLNFLRKTDKSISAITFSCDDIAILIKNLDPYKTHGHDMISIRI